MDTSRKNLYGGIQTVFPKGRELQPEERLLAAKRPLLAWYGEHKRELPWRENRDAYRIWISEIMLQQTRVEAVKPYFFRFMEHFPDISSLAAAGEEELFKCWEGLGYYSRARNLKRTAEIVEAEYGGVLPASREALLSLPGIGSYTAGAIASIAYGLPCPAVDGNVLRVLSRVTGSREDILKQSTKKKMEALAETLLADGDAGDINQALIETGAIVCVPNGEPLCPECPFYTVCAAREQGLTKEIPVKAPKKKRKIEEKTVLLLEYGDKIAIRKREDKGLLASLYEFPNLPGKLAQTEIEALFSFPVETESTCSARHIFSHTEWHMAGYVIRLPENLPDGWNQALPGGLIFAEYGELQGRYAVPSAFAAYKKLLEERQGG